MRNRVLLLVAAASRSRPARGAAGPLSRPARRRRSAARERRSSSQEFGGAETGPRAAYVESVGRRVAAYSGIANPGQALHFTTLNSAVENAFSVPGGYVYITRQLMTLMDDESQLAFALGHEVGHIAANHAHSREAVDAPATARSSACSGRCMARSSATVAFGDLIAAARQAARR